MKLTNEMQAFDLLTRAFYRMSNDGKAHESFCEALDILLAARSEVRETLTPEEGTVAHIIEMLHITRLGGARYIGGELAKPIPKGQFYRTGLKPNYSVFRKSTLAEYQRCESSTPVVTHVQVEEDGTEWHFLQTFGLDSWAIKVSI